MKKIDYNKIMFIVAVILIVMFLLFIINDYKQIIYIKNASIVLNKVLIYRMLQFILPSIVLLYLYEQNTYLKNIKIHIQDNKLPKKFNCKIAQLSDFHNTNSKRLKVKLKNVLEQEKPDIIVITGDLLDARRTNIQTVKQFINMIKHIAPIYYVLGNHEARISNVHELITEVKNEGVHVIRNEVIKLEKAGESIELIGLDDPGFFVTSLEENIKEKIDIKLNELINSDSDKYRILLTHRPELIDTYSKPDIDLIFTGHAHGGQIRIPFLGGIIAPGQGFFPKYTKGLYVKNDTKMIVSCGIGNSKFPFRLNNRPNIIFAILENKK